MIESYSHTVTHLEALLGQIQGTVETEASTFVHPVSVRIPTVEFASIEALAAHSGMSRNKVICQLLEVAISEVYQGLDDGVAKKINKIRTKLIQQLMDGQNDNAKPGEC